MKSHFFIILAFGLVILSPYALHSQDKTLVQLQKQLQDKNPEQRRLAVLSLQRMGQHSQAAIHQLVNVLFQDPDTHVREQAATSLGKLQEHAKIILPTLVDAILYAQDKRDIYLATEVLHELQDHATQVVPELIHALNDPWLPRKVRALEAITRLEKYAKITIPNLIPLLQDKNRHIRQQTILALETFGADAHSAAPTLVDTLTKDPDHDIKLSASRALRKIGPYAKEIIPKLSDALYETSQTNDRNNILYVLEGLRTTFPHEIDEVLSKKPTPTHNPNLCSILCQLVNHSAQWIDEHYKHPPYGFHRETYGFSLLWMSALFLEKASPFCKAAQPIVDNIVSHLAEQSFSSENLTPQRCDFPFEDLKNLSTQILDSLVMIDSPQVYGKEFYILFLRNVLRKKTTLHRDELESLLKKAQDSLRRDLKARPLTANGNSAFNTFALSSALLTLDHVDNEAMQALNESIDPENPLRIKYQSNKNFESERGSAARAIVVHLTRYTKEPQKRETIRKDLIAALQNYVKVLPALIEHWLGGGVHLGQDRLASYYLPASIPHATQALDILLKENRPGEKEVLEKLKIKTKNSLVGLMDENGLFKAPRSQDDNASMGYGHPLFGLALIPLVEKCAPVNKLEP
ncbi:MAG: HEAT repeat domain-containing protein [Deltaproteobacteria bacterium]|nr:HEAT repeat domain-containing protein [Deltaproteobacteria bacterium]